MASGAETHETKQVTIRLDPTLHKELRRVTLERDTSIQEVTADLLAKYVAHYRGAA